MTVPRLQFPTWWVCWINSVLFCIHLLECGCFQKYGYTQIIHFKRVFHYFHHPFWGPTPFFGNTHVSFGNEFFVTHPQVDKWVKHSLKLRLPPLTENENFSLGLPIFRRDLLVWGRVFHPLILKKKPNILMPVPKRSTHMFVNLNLTKWNHISPT